MESLNELMRTFKEFTNYSGLNVTYSKTDILKIGLVRFTQDILPTDEDFQWAETIMVLGIKFTGNLNIINDIMII